MQVITPYVNIFRKLKKLVLLLSLVLLNACSFSQSNNPMDSTEELEKFGDKLLPKNVCHVIKEGGTERPFTGKYVYHKANGTYCCIGCDAPLFSSTTKFDSGSGWPSFYDVIASGSIKEVKDLSYGMERIEIRCATCDAHLGHVFEDGPKPTGLRYCVNSVSLDFKPVDDGVEMEEITLGAGCFWCVETCFKELEGVIEVYPGYAGGKTLNPTYEQVCSGTTGHAEVARIVFDPAVISVNEILELFWWIHDPTQLNRQGNDIGTQYRSVIFYHNEAQKEVSESYLKRLTKEEVWDKPIVTEITALNNFYRAEQYHHDYFNLNPENQYCQFVVRPKVEKFRKVFKEKLKGH
jgi:peptide methionine sulfoxide reductase msrA/msrB